ncbi:MAG: permease [bacterium]|nr:permease [bacterium]
MNHIAGIIREAWTLFLQMSFYLVLGFLFAGFIHIFLKTEFIFKHLGKKGISSIIKAVLFGVPLPLCSCGVLPPASTLYKYGATKGSVIAFLIATPTTGIDSIFATYGLLGGIFMIFRIGVSIIIGFFAGVLTDIFPKDELTDRKNILEDSISCSESTIPAAFRYAFVELYGSIAKWIFWGVLIGGTISYLVPDEIISGYTDNRWLTYLLMLVVGLPLYVCATGSIPIAASLIAKGMSPGAGLVFLIVGPATNSVTMLFVEKMLGKKSFIIYITTVIVGSILSGFLFDTIVNNYSINVSESFHKHKDFSLLSYLSSFLLIGFSLNSMIEVLRKKVVCRRCKYHFIFSVPDISCSNCAKRIKDGLYSIKGVKNVEVNVNRKEVRICSEFDNKAEIKKILAATGYSTPDF